MRRVVVTGVGCVSPVGVNAENSWNAVLNGESGVKSVDMYDCSRLYSQVGAFTHKDFDASQYLSAKQERRRDMFVILGSASANMALKDSGYVVETEEQAYRSAVVAGSGVGAIQSVQKEVLNYGNNPDTSKVNPFLATRFALNMLSGYISMDYGFKGANMSIVTACASGSHAIANSAMMIKNNLADVVVAGGSEAGCCYITMAAFDKIGSLSRGFNDTPEKASRPYDRLRDGFVMAEGAAMVVLEEYEHAKARGAKIYAELSGCGMTADAYHETAPDPQGRGGFHSMKLALNEANLDTSDIDYLSAHGTSTPMGDSIELLAIDRLFSGTNDHMLISSTKGSTGHLLGASGALEAIFSVLSIRDGVAPPTVNLDDIAVETSFDLVPKVKKKKKIKSVLSNSFGFGGTNCSLLFKSMD